MNHSQPPVFAEKRAAAAKRRAGLTGLVLAVGMLVPVQLDAAVDGRDSIERSHAERGDARFPSISHRLPGSVLGAGAVTAVLVVARADTLAQAVGSDAAAKGEGTSRLARPQPADPVPAGLGFVERMQDWLARANREFQATVVPRLSIPADSAHSSSRDAARTVEQFKDLDPDIAASIRRAEDALKSVEAKREEEARKREAQRAEEAAKQAAAEAKAEAERSALLAKAEADALARETERMEAEVDAAVREAHDRELAAAAKATPAPPSVEEASRLAEDLRKERARIEAEAARIERERVAALEQRKADEAKAREEERVRVAARIAEEKPRVANLEEEKDSERTVELTTEPIPASELPRVRSRTEAEEEPQTRVSRARVRLARAPVVKRWIWRSNQHRSVCRFAGRTIKLPGRYVVRRGDTLWAISRRHYRDGRRYMRIYRANRSILRSPHRIYPCQRLYLPRPF